MFYSPLLSGYQQEENCSSLSRENVRNSKFVGSISEHEGVDFSSSGQLTEQNMAQCLICATLWRVSSKWKPRFLTKKGMSQPEMDIGVILGMT